MKALKTIAFVLLVIGGLNWLLVGLFKIDVGMIFGGQEALISRIVYILVGLSAIYTIFAPCGCCCGKGEAPKTAPQAPTM